MSTGRLIGLILVLVAVADLGIGWAVIVPRAPEESRGMLRAAIGAGAAILVVLGTLFLTGVLGLD
jgi:hypothetical protein